MPIIEIDFKCDHCGQEFCDDNFNIAVFLYGLFILLGKEKEYVGLTCPSCIKTILIKDNSDLVSYTKQYLLSGEYEMSFPVYFVTEKDDHSNFSQKTIPFGSQIRYHSFLRSNPKQIPELRDFEILDWSGELTEYIEAELDFYMEENPYFKENYLCPYIKGGTPLMGVNFSVWWFRDDQIDDLVDIENNKGLRVFPRYIHKISEIEKIEQFCWDNHIYLNNLIEQEKEAEAQISELKEIAKQNNMNLQEILAANPGIMTPKIIKHMKNQYDVWLEDRSFRVPTDFMTILTTSLSPAGSIFPNYSPLQSFLKTKHPFRGKEVPKSLNSIDLIKFEKPQKGLNYKEMAKVVKTNFSKESTQKSLSILSKKFIFDYIEIAQKVGFAYGAIWELKEKYLKIIYDSINSPQERNTLLNGVSKAEFKEVQKAEAQFPNVKIISNDSEINNIKINLSRYAKLKWKDVDILLLGESGTGKELFAAAFNASSGRDNDKFEIVNCGSIPENLFESKFFGHEKGAFTDAKEKQLGHFEKADGGTIFLDEIGELSLNNQKRFLRVIENREIQPVGGKSKKVDVKIVYATNRDLNQMVENGSFRRDLYHRINVFPFHIPPLRDRKNDIPLLVEHFIKEYDDHLKNNPDLKSIRVTDDCMSLLKNYKWEGNVRDLKNVIRRIIANRLIDNNREEITPSDLPQDILNPVDPEKPNSNPQKVRKKKPTRKELIQFKKDGIFQKEIAKMYGKDPSTVSKWYKVLNEGA